MMPGIRPQSLKESGIVLGAQLVRFVTFEGPRLPHFHFKWAQKGKLVILDGIRKSEFYRSSEIQLQMAQVTFGSVLIGVGTTNVVGMSIESVNHATENQWPLVLAFLVPQSQQVRALVRLDSLTPSSFRLRSPPWKSRFLLLRPTHELVVSKANHNKADRVRACIALSGATMEHVKGDSKLLEIRIRAEAIDMDITLRGPQSELMAMGESLFLSHAISNADVLCIQRIARLLHLSNPNLESMAPPSIEVNLPTPILFIVFDYLPNHDERVVIPCSIPPAMRYALTSDVASPTDSGSVPTFSHDVLRTRSRVPEQSGARGQATLTRSATFRCPSSQCACCIRPPPPSIPHHT